MRLIFGNNDPQFSGVRPGIAGQGIHPKSVVWHRQKKITGSKPHMHAHSRVGGQGQRFKPKWDKTLSKMSKKAAKAGMKKKVPMAKQIAESVRQELTKNPANGGNRAKYKVTGAQRHAMGFAAGTPEWKKYMGKHEMEE